MATTTIIWLVTLGAKCLAALICLFVACAKLIDWRRQKHVPLQLSIRSQRGTETADSGVMHTAQRRAPVMAGKSHETVAKFADVAEHMKTGDILTFSGRSLWSYILRIGTFSDKSHAALTIRDKDGKWSEWLREQGIGFEEISSGLLVVDSAEGRNVSARPLLDDVQKWPGQWYWHAIRHEFTHNYHREQAAEAAMSMIENKTRYGWIGIIFQAFIRLPVLREIAYVIHLDRLPYYRKRPFCSQAVKDWMHAGSLDPVPGRAGQLVTPQDINQSLAGLEGIALVP
jgi:hypothetical protein